MNEIVVPQADSSPSEIEALDFEPDLPCEGTDFQFPGCEQVAAWWVTCRRCNNGRPLCDHCTRLLRMKIEIEGRGAECYRCRVHVPTLDELAWITPVRSQS